MRYNKLGRTGLLVSELCLGTMTFGGGRTGPGSAIGNLQQDEVDGQLRTALSTMPADVKEYTDCYDVIQRALLAQIGSSHQSGGGGQGSGGSFLPTPLIVVLVVLVVGTAGFAAVAARRRGGGGGPANGS